MTRTGLGRRRPPLMTAGTLYLLTTAICSSTLLASEPLTLIPADVAAVVSFRDLRSSGAKLDAFIRRFRKDHRGVDLDEVQRGFNLEDGVVDTSAPAFLVLTRSRLQKSAFALVFTPRDEAAFFERVGKKNGIARRCEGPEGRFWLMMREGVAFVSHKRRTIRLFRRVQPERSLAAALDAEQEALFDSSDLVVHLPLARWRERINPLFFLAGNMMKLGIAAQQGQETIEGSLLVAGWMVDGAHALVDQMEAVTLALDFNGETFRITHYHTFSPGGSVADYLGQVERPGTELWAVHPDRPFFAVGALDWRCPPGTSVAESLRTLIFSAKSFAESTPAELRRRLLDTTAACWGQIRGSHFMVTSPEGKLHPLRFYGGYEMEDAEKGLQQLRFLQENSYEAMFSFMGGPYFSEFEERRTRDGKRFVEMRFALDEMNPVIRQKTIGIYGQSVRFQQGIVDRHHLVYAIGQPPTGVRELMEPRPIGQRVGDNPLVRRVVSLLPRDPNALIVLDVGRCLAVMPHLVLASTSGMDPVPRQEEAISPDHLVPPGPMLGWAGMVRPTAFKGQLVMGADDALRMFELTRQMVKNVSDVVRRQPSAGGRD